MSPSISKDTLNEKSSEMNDTFLNVSGAGVSTAQQVR